MAQGEHETGIGRPLRRGRHVELRIDRHDGTEQPQRLVDDVATNVAQEAARWTGL
jgi:hypothetical protein